MKLLRVAMQGQKSVVARLKHTLARREADLDNVTRSRSYRLMAPLRFLNRQLRRLSRRLSRPGT